MRLLRKLFLLICAIIVMVGMLSTWLLLYPRRYDDGLTLQDVSGDRSYLNNVRFHGVLADDIVRTTFQFEDNQWEKEFRFVTEEDSSKQYHYSHGYKDITRYPYPMVVSLEMTDVVPNPNPGGFAEDEQGNRSEAYIGDGIITYSVQNRRFSSDVIWSGHMTQSISLVVSGDYGEYDDFDRMNSTKGFLWKDDRLYLYTITDSYCSGYGGVYDITELFQAGWYKVDEPKSSERPNEVDISKPLGPGAVWVELPNIAPLDLEDGKVQIIDMAATENSFIYLYVRNQLLYMRAFHLETNSFENEIEVGKIPENVHALSMYKNRVINGKPQGDFTDMVCVDNIICLAVSSNASSSDYLDYDYGLSYAYYAVDIVGGKLLQAVMEESDRNEKTSMRNLDMTYKNDALYVFGKYDINRSEDLNDIENHLKISVYKKSQSVYQGNILSDAQEDYKYRFWPQEPETKITMRDYYYIGIE
jgi:hypothetical protein